MLLSVRPQLSHHPFLITVEIPETVFMFEEFELTVLIAVWSEEVGGCMGDYWDGF